MHMAKDHMENISEDSELTDEDASESNSSSSMEELKTSAVQKKQFRTADRAT